MAYCGGVLSIVVTDTGKIFSGLKKGGEARLCQTDATSCHKTGKRSTGHGFAYICPKTSKYKDMEIVIIEKKTFEALLSGVETLTGKVGALCRRCSDKRMQKWLDGEDVCRLLRISPRTLQTLRDNRIIGCTQINRKFYYKPEEVERVLPVIGRFRTERDNIP